MSEENGVEMELFVNDSEVVLKDASPALIPADEDTNMESMALPDTTPVSETSVDPSTPEYDIGQVQILEAIQSLSGKLAALHQGFESKIKYDASKEKMVDTLHKELQSYREDLHFKILRPVIMDLISMHDDMSSLLTHAAEVNDPSESEINLRRSLLTFLETISEILERNGVTSYSEVNTAFVAQRQRAIKVIHTPDIEQDGLTAERLRCGFEYSGRVLRPEIISVFKHKVQI